MDLRIEIEALRPMMRRLLADPTNAALLLHVSTSLDELLKSCGDKAVRLALNILRNEFLSQFELRRDDAQYPAKKALLLIERALDTALLSVAKDATSKPAADDAAKLGLGDAKNTARIATLLRSAESEIVRRLTAGHGLYVGPAPIVLPFTLRQDVLSKQGVRVESLHGYPLLLNQVVCVVQASFVERQMRADDEWPEDPDALTSRQTNQFRARQQEVASSVAETAFAARRVQHASEYVSHWNKSQVFWGATSAMLRQLRNAAFGGHFAPTKWALGFDNSL